MTRLEHPGKRSYWHLAGGPRKPSEYAVRSERLDYYQPHRFEVNAPLGAWFERYGAARSFEGCDWERFDDPRATTYARYVAQRRDDELFVQRLLDGDNEGPADSALHTALSALRFPYHGLQMAAAYVAHLAPASKISICSMFQAADQLRRVQRLAYRLAQLEARTGASLGGAGREAWLTAPAWQGLRALIETLLTSFDFGDAFFALTRSVAPACDALLLGGLSRRLAAAGDLTSARLLDALHQDSQWHNEWSGALSELVCQADPRNLLRVREIEQRFAAPLRAALAPLRAEYSLASEPELDQLLSPRHPEIEHG
ncbi:MAG: hypothetical protein QM756_39640 [Polyangiaceae bacterium]